MRLPPVDGLARLARRLLGRDAARRPLGRTAADAVALRDGATLSLMPFADAAVAEGIHSSRPGDPWGLGFGAWLGADKGRGRLDLALGYAPWIERQPEVGRLSVFARLAVDWGQGSRIWRPQG